MSFAYSTRLAPSCCWVLVIGVLVGWISGRTVQAGGSPETTLIVVNADSIESRRIANYYVELRDIPPTNIVWLDSVSNSPIIDMETFRDAIWKPIRAHLYKHGLDDEVDVIAYSAGFPYAVDFNKDLPREKFPKGPVPLLGKFASLTGLTFFARRVELRDIGFLSRNLYARRDVASGLQTQRGFNEAEAALYKRADKLIRQQKHQEAEAVLAELLELYPWSAQVWYQMAATQAALGRSGQAISTLGKAVQMGWRHSLTARTDLRFRTVRDVPRFQELTERMRQRYTLFQAAHGFRGRYVWDGQGRPAQKAPRDSLDRYFLSMMLGYTKFNGNTVGEVLRYLKRAAASDGTNPSGTVYLMENSNIRARTRELYFYATASALKERGHRVEIISRGEGQDGLVPRARDDVIGVVAGTAHFNWERSKSQFLPGAIAESLTSYGGHFENFGHTKLSEFLQHGAAGSSGAVSEPYAIQAKFPVAYMHVHYADGSSLAEAFYQSVELPYQLIIVGDPLARPFATFARVNLDGPDKDGPWKDAVLLVPSVDSPEDAIKHFELWVDGKLVDVVAPWDVFLWDTREVDDGAHDLRIVAVSSDRIETRSYVKIEANVSNTDCRITAKSNSKSVAYEDKIVLEGVAENAVEVGIRHGVRQLVSAQIDGARWKVSLPASTVGPGPVELFARARARDGHGCRSAPIFTDIEPPIY